MESKYTIINKSEEVEYIETCPLILVAYAITRDNELDQALVQLKMQSLARKKIKAVYIAVKCFDIEGVELKSIDNFEFPDLNVDFNEYFGQSTPIYLPDKCTKNVEISVSKILFSDETYWKNDTTDYFKDLPALKHIEYSLPPDLKEQYGREINIKKNKYLPIDNPNYWICSCGSYNLSSEDRCHECKNNQKSIFRLCNENHLSNTLKQYNAIKSIEEGKIRHIYEQKVIKNKQFMRIGVIAILIIIAIFSINGLIIPELKYSKAVSLFEQEEYAEAFELFNELDTYKDSDAKKEETDKFSTRKSTYDEGIAAYNQGDYLDAYKLFLKYPEYKEAAEYIKNSEDAIYKQALNFVETDELDTALLYFESIPNYKDSNIKANDLTYFKQANQCYQEGNIDEALVLLNSIDEKSEAAVSIEKDILNFKSEYGKWLGKWGYESNDYYILLIKPQWKDNQLTLRFESYSSNEYFLYKDNGDGTISYSISDGAIYYYTLTYVSDSTITRITTKKSNDETSTEEHLYKKN